MTCSNTSQAIAAQTIIGWVVKDKVVIRREVIMDYKYQIIPQVICD